MATKNKNAVLAAEVGAGLAAVGAAAAAGYYFYASKDAKKHRKVAAKWADGLKKEVIKETKRLQDIDARSVARAIDTAASTYAAARSIDAGEIRRATAELKKNWELVK